MQNLSDVNTIKSILKRHGFSFSKALGQNFIIDPELCPQIAELSGINENCGVIEIGAGIGVLTVELAKRARKVVSLELDGRLLPVLAQSLDGCNNVEVLNEDILKIDINKLIAERFDSMPVYVCANLPYYITSPIIMKFLEGRARVESMTLMVQSEAAERLCADVGTREAGAVSVAVEYYAEAKRLLFVPRESFLPSPNVDSEIIKLDIRKEPSVKPSNEAFFFSLVKAAFSQRRKTAQNGISTLADISKADVAAAFTQMGLDVNIRAEKLNLEQLSQLSDILSNNKIMREEA